MVNTLSGDNEMPYTTEWLVPQRILLKRFSGTLTIDDFQAAYTSNCQSIADSNEIVHIIDDMRAVTGFPNSILKIAKAISRVDSQRCGYLVTITSNPILRFTTSTLAHLMTIRHRSVNKLEEACAFLLSVDDSLDSIQC